MSAVLVCALSTAGAVALALPAQRRLLVEHARTVDMSPEDSLPRRSVAIAGGAGVAAWVFLGGTAGVMAGVAASAASWWVLNKAEPPHLRRRRQAITRDLPIAVGLIGAALRAGADPTSATLAAARALGGPCGTHLADLVRGLELAADPGEVWAVVAHDPTLAPLGHAFARAHRSGAPPAAVVQRLSVELGREARSDAEARARKVGVQAAVPLGVCLLPAFLLLGIVPVIAGLADALAL